MPRYKILHLIGGETVGGAEQHVLNLLENINPSEFSPALICLTKGSFAKLAQQHGIPTETFPMRNPLDLPLIPKIVRWARSQGIQLFHTHGSRGNLLGRLGAKALNIPVVTTYHSSLAHDYLSPWSSKLAIFLDRLTLPIAAEVIAVSDYLKNEVSKRGGKQVQTIYNGLPLFPSLDTKAIRRDYRKKFCIPDDTYVIGSIARLHPTKGHHTLIQAAARMRTSLPKLHLLIIGDGPLYHDIEHELKQKNIPFTLTGFFPDAYKLLPVMDLFVLPSISEGMGLVLLEAMQAKIPIVASQAGGIPEVVRSGQDALLVPPSDEQALASACLEILENHELRQSIIQSASQRRSLFSIDAMVKETERLYLDILANP